MNIELLGYCVIIQDGGFRETKLACCSEKVS